MNYYWLNTGNMIEIGGPYTSVQAAKDGAVQTYHAIGDSASSMVILGLEKIETPKYFDKDRFGDNERRLKEGKVVAKGSIYKEWVEAT